MRAIILFFFLCLLNFQVTHAQIYNNGGTVYIQPAATVFSSLNICNVNSGTFINEGTATTIQNIKNTTGGTLSGDGLYQVHGHWTNTATFAAGTSTAEFVGPTAAQIHSGGDDFYRMSINKSPGATTTLGVDASIAHQLNFIATKNQIFLGNNDLVIRPAASINGYDETNYMVTNNDGMVKKENLSNFTFPVGANSSTYNPMTLRENGDVDEIGVRNMPDALEDGTSGSPETSNFVATSWMVSEGIAGGSVLDMTAQWNGSDELPGFDRANSTITRFEAGDWMNVSGGTAAVGSDPYSSTTSPIEELGLFSVTSDIVAPLQLITFNVENHKDKEAIVSWETHAEININYFDLEKSTDSKNWTSISKVAAKGNSFTTTTYEFIDKAIQAYQANDNIFYYRLKIVENDASFTYSAIKSIEIHQKDDWISIYPNPTETGVFIHPSVALEDKQLLLNLIDLSGKVVLSTQLSTVSNGSFWTFPDLPAGVYHLELSSNQEVLQVEQLVVK